MMWIHCWHKGPYICWHKWPYHALWHPSWKFNLFQQSAHISVHVPGSWSLAHIHNTTQDTKAFLLKHPPMLSSNSWYYQPCTWSCDSSHRG
jgi:hypothetical protein